MTEVLVQPDCQLGLACERLDRCGLDALEESPERKRAPNTGARLWGRVRSKLLRQKGSFCGPPSFPQQRGSPPPEICRFSSRLGPDGASWLADSWET
ncbi:UNVERIFIED_CONTAM: hypothetical protein K2H54_031624 [Gekko kuhli]